MCQVPAQSFRSPPIRRAVALAYDPPETSIGRMHRGPQGPPSGKSEIRNSKHETNGKTERFKTRKPEKGGAVTEDSGARFPFLPSWPPQAIVFRISPLLFVSNYVLRASNLPYLCSNVTFLSDWHGSCTVYEWSSLRIRRLDRSRVTANCAGLYKSLKVFCQTLFDWHENCNTLSGVGVRHATEARERSRSRFITLTHMSLVS
jgi:hypothetical protein